MEHTDDKRTVEVEDSETLISGLIKSDISLVINAKHGLFTISLDVNGMPEVVVEWVSRHLFQSLDSVADIKSELNDVADCK